MIAGRVTGVFRRFKLGNVAGDELSTLEKSQFGTIWTGQSQSWTLLVQGLRRSVKQHLEEGWPHWDMRRRYLAVSSPKHVNVSCLFKVCRSFTAGLWCKNHHRVYDFIVQGLVLCCFMRQSRLMAEALLDSSRCFKAWKTKPELCKGHQVLYWTFQTEVQPAISAVSMKTTPIIDNDLRTTL